MSPVHGFAAYEALQIEPLIPGSPWPAFNLKKMGLGAESRDLSVQVSGPGI